MLSKAKGREHNQMVPEDLAHGGNVEQTVLKTGDPPTLRWLKLFEKLVSPARPPRGPRASRRASLPAALPRVGPRAAHRLFSSVLGRKPSQSW